MRRRVQAQFHFPNDQQRAFELATSPIIGTDPSQVLTIVK